MKRQRGASFASAGRSPVIIQQQARRPIDKQLIGIVKNVGTAQLSTDLYTVTFPGTMVGLRWDLAAVSTGASTARYYWAIVVVKDGLSASTMATSDGSSFYQPETNCLAFGGGYVMGNATGGTTTAHEVGHTKAMRKLQAGDKLQYIVVADQAAGVGIMGNVQFFIKS